jgi:hypothetical protein
MRNMADIVQNLEQKLAPLSSQGKKQFLLELGFSDKSVSFVQMLIGTSDKIREYEGALREAGGFTKEVAEHNIPVFTMAIHRLKTAFESLSISAGAPILEHFGQAIIYVTDVLAHFTEHQLANSIMQTGVFATGFVAALFVFPKVVSGIRLLATAFKTLAAGEALTAAMANPLYAALAAIAGIAAVAAVNTAFEGLDAQAATAQTALEQTAASAKTAMQAAGDEADEVGDGIETVSKKAAKAAEKAAKQMESEAAHITASMRTPAEVMADTVGRLNELVYEGAISWETYRRAVLKANKELSEANAHEESHSSRSDNAAVVRGTTAAFSAVERGRSEMERIAKAGQQQLDAAKQANELLNAIKTNTAKAPVTLKQASI